MDKKTILTVVALVVVFVFLFIIGGMIFFISTHDNKRFTVGIRNKQEEEPKEEKSQSLFMEVAKLLE